MVLFSVTMHIVIENSKNRLKLTAVEATTSSKENRNRPPIKSFFLVAEVAASGARRRFFEL